MTKIRFYSFIRIPMPGLFPCLCGAITELFFAIGPSDVGVDLVGSTFNIQNFIPHKSQKPKAMAEINRPMEFQRGTVGATESAKEGRRVLAEGSDIGLGPSGREFESPISDHNWTPVLIQCVSKRVFSFFFQKRLFARVFIYLLTKAGSTVTEKWSP